VISDQLSVISDQLSVISYQLSVISYQLSRFILAGESLAEESKIYLGRRTPRFILAGGLQDLSWQEDSKIYLGRGVQDLSWQGSPRFILAGGLQDLSWQEDSKIYIESDFLGSIKWASLSNLSTLLVIASRNKILNLSRPKRLQLSLIKKNNSFFIFHFSFFIIKVGQSIELINYPS
jgi:hypothetical protein